MEKHIQTKLPEATYFRLRRLARAEKRTLKEIVREAVEAYLQSREGPDPLDDVIGSIELGDAWSTRKHWRDPFTRKSNNCT